MENISDVSKNTMHYDRSGNGDGFRRVTFALYNLSRMLSGLRKRRPLCTDLTISEQNVKKSLNL